MTQEEIQEYNKRCAKFMGFYYKDDNTVQPIHNWVTGLSTMTYSPKTYLKFDSDWNWIMEVLSQITKIGWNWSLIDFKGTVKEEKPFEVAIFNLDLDKPYNKILFSAISPKEAVVQAINQFLIWYNKTI